MRRLTPSVTLCVVMTVPILVRPVPAVHAQTTFFSTSFQETENSPVPGNSVTNYADPSTANTHVPSEDPTDYSPYTANLLDFLIPASNGQCGGGHPNYDLTLTAVPGTYRKSRTMLLYRKSYRTLASASSGERLGLLLNGLAARITLCACQRSITVNWTTNW